MSTRKSRNPKSTVKTQAEINRVKPLGTLSLEVAKEKSKRVITINVKLPDGEIYEFYHFPITLGRGEQFYEDSETSRLDALANLLSETLCNKDGSPFAGPDDLREIDIKILQSIEEAIMESGKTEGGED